MAYATISAPSAAYRRDRLEQPSSALPNQRKINRQLKRRTKSPRDADSSTRSRCLALAWYRRDCEPISAAICRVLDVASPRAGLAVPAALRDRIRRWKRVSSFATSACRQRRHHRPRQNQHGDPSDRDLDCNNGLTEEEVAACRHRRTCLGKAVISSARDIDASIALGAQLGPDAASPRRQRRFVGRCAVRDQLPRSRSTLNRSSHLRQLRRNALGEISQTTNHQSTVASLHMISLTFRLTRRPTRRRFAHRRPGQDQRRAAQRPRRQIVIDKPPPHLTNMVNDSMLAADAVAPAPTSGVHSFQLAPQLPPQRQ